MKIHSADQFQDMAGNNILDSVLTNPMTSKGDLIYGDTDGLPTRLPKGTDGQALVLSSGLPSWQTPSAGGGIWTAITGTRTANTTFTLSGDQTAIFSKGLIVRWKESTTDRLGMVVSSAYTSLTTVTIIGDTCASNADTFKYCSIPAEIVKFVIAGNLSTVTTNIMNTHIAMYSKRIIGADCYVETAGTTNNTTFDINVEGTTVFSTKPTLASTARYSSTPFTADSATTVSLGNAITIDLDAVQTTPAVTGYIDLYTFPTRLLNIN